MKSLSVRSQRSFQEHMKTLYQNIDTLVYAAELACNKERNARCDECAFTGCIECKLRALRKIIGDHYQQSDIEGVELSEG